MKITRRNFLKCFLSTVFLSGYNFPVYSDTKPKKNLIVIKFPAPTFNNKRGHGWGVLNIIGRRSAKNKTNVLGI